jgi:hypothetical protein
MRSGLLGAIITPAQGNKLETAFPMWCADNGCFGKGYPGDKGFLAWLDGLRPHLDRCWFAVAPDVVSDAAATLARSVPFLPAIRAMGYRPAFVAQNGCTPGMVPWNSISVLFLGGSKECVPCGFIRPITVADREMKRCPCCGRLLTEWKLSAAARLLAAEAISRGIDVHMGRLNSERRYREAFHMGCRSADGKYIAHGPDVNLPKALAWRRVHDQGVLFPEVAS